MKADLGLQSGMGFGTLIERSFGFLMTALHRLMVRGLRVLKIDLELDKIFHILKLGLEILFDNLFDILLIYLDILMRIYFDSLMMLIFGILSSGLDTWMKKVFDNPWVD